MRLLVVNNPSSGLGDNSIFDFLRVAGGEGDEIVLRNTSPASPLRELLADAEDFDFVVASGGDGTVTAICYELRYREVPIVPFPAGTGNLLSLNLSSPEEPRAIAEMIKRRNIEYYDLAEIAYFEDAVSEPGGGLAPGLAPAPSRGRTRVHGFAVMAGAGFDAVIMDGAKPFKNILGQSAYYLSALISDKPQKADLVLTIDGEKVITSGIAVMAVNFAKIAADISVTHVNDAQDGLLEVVVLKPESKAQLAPALIAAFLDRRGQYPSRSDALEIYAGREIHVEADPPLPIQFDGETAHATTPFTARCLPQALKAIVDDAEIERLETLQLIDRLEEGPERRGGQTGGRTGGRASGRASGRTGGHIDGRKSGRASEGSSERGTREPARTRRGRLHAKHESHAR